LTGKTSNPPTSDSDELRWYGYAFEIIDRQGFGYGDAYGRLQIPVQLLEMMGAVSKQYSQNLVHTDLAAIVRNHERSATQAVSPLGDSPLRPTIVLSFASLNPTIISSPTLTTGTARIPRAARSAAAAASVVTSWCSNRTPCDDSNEAIVAQLNHPGCV
jgi:hypothetical protein